MANIKNGPGTRAAALFLAVSLTLAACGGGGGAGAVGGGGSSATAASEVASLEVLKSTPTINSEGRDSVTLTVVAKNATNGVLANQPVTLTTTDTGARLSATTARTDGSGTATFTLTSSDPTNRTIRLDATSGPVGASASVDVVGTTLSINGPTAVVQGGTATYTIAVRNSAGAAVAGVPVKIESARANPVTPATATTDTNGQVVVAVVASSAQSDTVTVRASGASSSQELRVTPTAIALSTGANAAGEIEVGQPATVTVSLRDGGQPANGALVALTATRGALSAYQVTVSNGVATATIFSPSAGLSSIQATAPDGTIATANVEFVSRTPAKLSVQASPSVVGVNLAGATQPQTSQIIAVVRDGNDNPVKGATVNFSAVDPSNGSLSPPSAITDRSGIASVVFTPGPTATGNNAIRITGSVAGSSLPALTQVATLTAARRELSIAFGTGNELIKVDELFNEVPYGVIVTDSAGNPVPNVKVQASVAPVPGFAYAKGVWALNPVSNKWEQHRSANCRNEDANANLLRDPGEDANGNGRLDPAPSDAGAVYFVGGVATTDSAGSAALRVRYLRDRSAWVQVRLSVSATVVAGTEGFGSVDFWLPMRAEDVSNATVAPPGATSPFGESDSCFDPN